MMRGRWRWLGGLLGAVAALRLPGTVLGLAVAALMIAAPVQAKVAGKPGIFGYLETQRTGLKAFPKWTGALERYFEERGKVSGACTAKSFNRCHYQGWKRFLDGVKDAPDGRKLKKINDFMNKARYIIDPINWGVKDYWESPGQFFNKYGDCEDYAIAKYLSLRAIGWDPKKMRIVVVQDLNLRIPHAVLAVYVGDKVMLLDNQIAIVVDASKIRHYRPIFSVSETAWWRHAPSGRKMIRRRRRAKRG